MTSGEQFIDRVAERVDDKEVRGWEIIIPMIFDFIMQMIENCQQPEVVAACEDVSEANRLAFRRACMRRAIAASRDNGWGLFEAARIGRHMAEQIIAEAEATVDIDRTAAEKVVGEFLALVG